MIRMYDDNGDVIDIVEHDREIYNKAIDDFLTVMKRDIHIEAYFMDRNFKHTIEDIAEQLKEKKNEIRTS